MEFAAVLPRTVATRHVHDIMSRRVQLCIYSCACKTRVASRPGSVSCPLSRVQCRTPLGMNVPSIPSRRASKTERRNTTAVYTAVRIHTAVACTVYRRPCTAVKPYVVKLWYGGRGEVVWSRAGSRGRSRRGRKGAGGRPRRNGVVPHGSGRPRTAIANNPPRSIRIP